jgi:hypothetical protein
MLAATGQVAASPSGGHSRTGLAVELAPAGRFSWSGRTAARLECPLARVEFLALPGERPDLAVERDRSIAAINPQVRVLGEIYHHFARDCVISNDEILDREPATFPAVCRRQETTRDTNLGYLAVDVDVHLLIELI